jgi:hypothetical protein
MVVESQVSKCPRLPFTQISVSDLGYVRTPPGSVSINPSPVICNALAARRLQNLKEDHESIRTDQTNSQLIPDVSRVKQCAQLCRPETSPFGSAVLVAGGWPSGCRRNDEGMCQAAVDL